MKGFVLNTWYLAVVVAILMMGCGTSPPRSTSQPAMCADSAAAASLASYARRLASDTTAAYRGSRQRYNIPVVPVSDVQIVQDEVICTRASRAYAEANGSAAPIPIIVVGIGRRFIVQDPDYENPNSEFTLNIVLDQDFKVLALFAG